MLALGGGDIRGWNCWDLGAHFGLYSVGLARRVGPTGQVVAFEPNPKSYARLLRHKRMNRLDWLKTFPCAVSESSGSANLLTYGDLGTTTTHLAYEGETITPSVGPLSVETVSIDELVARGELRLPHFVKIDVEGHGHKALKGMAKTLAEARPILIVGFHSSPEVEGMSALLDPLGYTCTSIQSEGSGHLARGDFLFTPSPGVRGGF
jgi:FkbM family methyltransferase